jgi:hypothetical protein
MGRSPYGTFGLTFLRAVCLSDSARNREIEIPSNSVARRPHEVRLTLGAERSPMAGLPPLAVLLGAGFSQGLGLPGTNALTEAIDHAYDAAKLADPAHPDVIRYERLIQELRQEYEEDYSFEILVEALQSVRQFGESCNPARRPRSPLRPLLRVQP